MFDALYIVIGILGLAVLMVVHEAGHLLAARAFGMRVTTFSIGFGPTFFRIEPRDGYFWFTSLGGRVRLRLRKHDPEKHGPTVYQVAMIPFLAYVQIAGMNPFEDIDEKDKGSYANASLTGRIVTIVGGPLANYLFASVFFFFHFILAGVPAPPTDDTRVRVIDAMPAMEAGMQEGDEIVAVAGESVSNWKAMSESIKAHPAEAIDIAVLRNGERLTFEVKLHTQEDGKKMIGVAPVDQRVEATVLEAAELAVTRPPMVVRDLVVGLGMLVSGKAEAKLGGPAAITNAMAQAARRGFADLLALLGALSAYLGAFNLIPFPALDGGRLMFLGYELATRRRPNARVEAHIHVAGLLMLLGLMLYVTIFNDFGVGGGK